MNSTSSTPPSSSDLLVNFYNNNNQQQLSFTRNNSMIQPSKANFGQSILVGEDQMSDGSSIQSGSCGSTQSTTQSRRQMIHSSLQIDADFLEFLKTLKHLTKEELKAHSELKEKCKKILPKIQNSVVGGNWIGYATFKQDIISIILMLNSIEDHYATVKEVSFEHSSDNNQRQVFQRPNETHFSAFRSQFSSVPIQEEEKEEEEKQEDQTDSISMIQNEDEDSRLITSYRDHQDFVLIETQMQLFNGLKNSTSEEQRNKFIQENKVLIEKSLKKFGLGQSSDQIQTELENKVKLTKHISSACVVTATITTCFSIFMAPISHSLYFALDILTIWDLRRSRLIQCDKFIKSLGAKLGQHVIQLAGGAIVGIIGVIIGSLACPGLGTFILGLLGFAGGQYLIGKCCEKKIKEYLASDINEEKYRNEFYKKAIKTLGFKKAKSKDFHKITDEQIDIKLMIEWAKLQDPTLVNDKNKEKIQKKAVEILISYQVIQRYRNPEKINKQLEQIIQNYEKKKSKKDTSKDIHKKDVIRSPVPQRGLDNSAAEIDIDNP